MSNFPSLESLGHMTCDLTIVGCRSTKKAIVLQNVSSPRCYDLFKAAPEQCSNDSRRNSHRLLMLLVAWVCPTSLSCWSMVSFVILGHCGDLWARMKPPVECDKSVLCNSQCPSMPNMKDLLSNSSILWYCWCLFFKNQEDLLLKALITLYWGCVGCGDYLVLI